MYKCKNLFDSYMSDPDVQQKIEQCKCYELLRDTKVKIQTQI